MRMVDFAPLTPSHVIDKSNSREENTFTDLVQAVGEDAKINESMQSLR